ncbi:MAG: hypothetical protein JW940_20945 [Polyangiaceae bacterium]|nr:hypothetical protein [Polyangiaceae bacterium]
MAKLLKILLWTVVVVAPGGLLLLPVLAYRHFVGRDTAGGIALSQMTHPRLSPPADPG